MDTKFIFVYQPLEPSNVPTPTQPTHYLYIEGVFVDGFYTELVCDLEWGGMREDKVTNALLAY